MTRARVQLLPRLAPRNRGTAFVSLVHRTVLVSSSFTAANADSAARDVFLHPRRYTLLLGVFPAGGLSTTVTSSVRKQTRVSSR